MLHVFAVAAAVNLRAQRMHGWTLAAVQNPALQRIRVGSLSHFAAECVNLPHKVTFGSTADGRVAGHVADPVHIDGKDADLRTEPCGRQTGLNAGMSRADDDDVIGFCKVLHSASCANACFT